MADDQNDLERLRAVYRGRDQGGQGLYSLFNPAYLFMVQQRQRATLRLLHDLGLSKLAGKRLLEVGCGNGGVLYEYLGYGARPQEIHGIDLLPERVASAHRWLPHASVLTADGQRLPYKSGCFDGVLQYTMFSSILDDDVKANIAQEMLRVVRRPGGVIVWYDFWTNPTNPQTRGIHPAEIRQLFPGCRYLFQRITLAPPIARRLVQVSWVLCELLEKLSWLNTHYLVGIVPLE